MNDPIPSSSNSPHEPSAAEKAKDAAGQLKSTVTATASELGEAAQNLRENVQNKAAQASEYAGKTWTAARDQAKETGAHAVDYAREHPFPVVLTAFSVGLVIGLLCDLSEFRHY